MIASMMFVPVETFDTVVWVTRKPVKYHSAGKHVLGTYWAPSVSNVEIDQQLSVYV